ncbi:DUF2730 family protein [Brucella anthropi]|uniref:DUF2730 family protein n=1 Tax=Brucella anthropi TaxID=529 RepID=UPI000F6843F1|nr:DUF2730 family protein [Brucella anthropi]RRY02980.1 DUF2730 family protein [Brucella anthropi]
MLENISLAQIGQLINFLLAAAAFLGVVSGYIGKGAKEISAKVADHEHRLSKVENDLSHMPNTETVHQLQLAITEIKGQMGIMAKSSEATERTTRRVEEFLMQKGR